MTDKEFKWLGRSQLIDIIYQLQLKTEELEAENQKLKEALEDKRIRMDRAGNIAEAALEINKVMMIAQSAADQYLGEIRILRAEAEASCQQMIKEAKQEAAEIIAQAQTRGTTIDNAVEAIIEEFS